MNNPQFIQNEILKDINTRISTLEANVKQLNQIVHSIYVGVQQTHASLVSDVTSLMIRVNFMVEELKSNKTDDEKKILEEKFDTFDKSERSKMQEALTKAVEELEKNKAAKESENNVLQ